MKLVYLENQLEVALSLLRRFLRSNRYNVDLKCVAIISFKVTVNASVFLTWEDLSIFLRCKQLQDMRL